MTVPPLVAWLSRCIVPLGIGGFVIAFYLNIQSLPDDAVRYPNVVIAVTLLLAVINLVAEVMISGRRRREGGEDRETDVSPARLRVPPLAKVARPFSVIVLVAGFAWFVPRIGFHPAAFGFLLLTTLALGTRRPRNLALVSIGLSVVAYLLFDILLGVRLPSGQWGG